MLRQPLRTGGRPGRGQQIQIIPEGFQLQLPRLLLVPPRRVPSAGALRQTQAAAVWRGLSAPPQFAGVYCGQRPVVECHLHLPHRLVHLRLPARTEQQRVAHHLLAAARCGRPARAPASTCRSPSRRLAAAPPARRSRPARTAPSIAPARPDPSAAAAAGLTSRATRAPAAHRGSARARGRDDPPAAQWTAPARAPPPPPAASPRPAPRAAPATRRGSAWFS